MARNNRRQEKSEFEDRVVSINRVQKVTKGGNTLRFNALVVVGDGKGRVGYGMGKDLEVPNAIRKGVDAAKKNLIEVPIVGTTVPHETVGEFGAGRVLIKPAAAGSGVSAGGAVRAVMELAGVADVTTKNLGSDSPINQVAAVFEGIQNMKTAESVSKLRGIPVEELQG